MRARIVAIGALLASAAAAAVLMAPSASATTSYCVEVNGPNGNPHITTVCIPLP